MSALAAVSEKVVSIFRGKRARVAAAPISCPGCSGPPMIARLPAVGPYHCDITRRDVYPEPDDYRCIWCGSQWNEKERKSGVLRASFATRY